jgi:serine phosphatase RsbU (regulator of sigma subunit)
LSINYYNIGALYQSQKKYDRALMAFNSALSYAEEVNNPEQLALVNNSIGNYFLEQGNDKEAYNYFTRGLNFALSCGSMVERASAYKGLAQACRNLKMPTEAFDFLLRHSNLNDTINDLEKNRQVLDIGVRYETERKERELQDLKAQRSISELTEKNRQVVIYILVIGLGFVLLLAVLLFKNNRSRLKLNKQLNDRLDEINKSIAYAQKIQHTLLANEQFITQTLPQHFIFYKSKDIVSGDFYWATSVQSLDTVVHSSGSSAKTDTNSQLLTPGSELFYLAVCDSTGHGVPGAFMSLLNIGFLAEAVKEKNIRDTGEVFNYVRDRLVTVLGSEGQKDGFDGILLRFDRSRRKITYSAAHNSPILIYNDTLTELSHDKMPVGVGERNERFKTYDVDWIPGATLYLFTDGYADQFGGAKGKKFKYNQLYNLLLANSHRPLREQKKIIEKTFDDWRGKLEQVDDICVMGVRL